MVYKLTLETDEDKFMRELEVAYGKQCVHCLEEYSMAERAKKPVCPMQSDNPCLISLFGGIGRKISRDLKLEIRLVQRND